MPIPIDVTQLTTRVFLPKVDIPIIKLPVATGPNGGRLYTSPSGTFEVYGAILEKYLAFGAQRSVLGLPITNETGTPDGAGRYNHFQGGSIYWSPSTGAHVVYGAIRDRWAAIGWERSYLGYPLSDEEEFDEGGRVNQFQGGQVYWWPDTGAIDLNQVIVHYTGLVCFGETSWDQGSNSDEPYALFGVVSPTGGRAVSTRIYEDVDAKESRPDLVELYRGKPGGLVISITIMEHDEGDPNKYLSQVKGGVEAASKGIATVVSFIPVVGPILGQAIGSGLAAAKDAIAGALNSIFDFGDDVIGRATTTLSPKRMVVLAARTGNSTYKGIGYKAESDLISGSGASYKTYFGIITG